MEKEFSSTNPEGLTLAEIREIAYQEGLNASYTDGHIDGYEQGYIEGFNDGKEQRTVEIIKIKLDEGAIIPTRAHDTDAGADLYARERQVIRARDSAVFDTGVHVEIPHGYCGVLVSKSGLNVKHGILSTGLIDEGYTGSICVKLYNQTDANYIVEKGDKISQLVLIPYIAPCMVQVESLNDNTARGNNGFGSTGK